MTRKFASPCGLHGVRQAQEFGLKVIERESFIIQRTRPGKRVVGIKQRGAQRTGHGKDARKADGA